MSLYVVIWIFADIIILTTIWINNKQCCSASCFTSHTKIKVNTYKHLYPTGFSNYISLLSFVRYNYIHIPLLLLPHKLIILHNWNLFINAFGFLPLYDYRKILEKSWKHAVKENIEFLIYSASSPSFCFSHHHHHQLQFFPKFNWNLFSPFFPRLVFNSRGCGIVADVN